MAKGGRRNRTSRSWYLPPSERRELYIARHLEAAVELVVARAVEAGADSMSASWRHDVERDMQRMLNDAWSDGAENEADLRTARDGERLMRQRMERELRHHGIAVPTEPLPSDPPPPPKGDREP